MSDIDFAALRQFRKRVEKRLKYHSKRIWLGYRLSSYHGRQLVRLTMLRSDCFKAEAQGRIWESLSNF